MPLLLETVFFVFGLVALGAIAALTGYLRVEVGDALAQFAVGVALPLLLFRTIAGADFHGVIPWVLWGSYFGAVIVAWTLGHLLTVRAFGRDGQTGVVGGVPAAFSNLLLLGIPFMQGVLGQQGFETLSLIIAIHLPTMLMASIILFQVFGRSGDGELHPASALKTFALRTVKNPLIVGIALGFLWRWGGLTLPGYATRLVDALAGIASPLALFAVGLGLKKYGISGNFGAGLALSLVKLLLMPTVALGLVLLLGLPPLAAKVVVLSAALPAGVNSYLIATQFGTGQAIASNAMTIGTASAAVSMSLWLLALQSIYG